MKLARNRGRRTVLAWVVSVGSGTLACGDVDPIADAADADADGTGSTGASETGAHDTGTFGTTASGTSPAPPPDLRAETSSTGVDVACEGVSLEPGLHADLEIEHDSLTRSYDLFVPSAAEAGAPLPLVVNMHGWGSSKEQQAAFSQMSADAERRGYAIAYLQGYDASFNAGFCCGGASDDDIDDVGFAVAVVDDVDRRACLDRDRVYATGFSNGAFMAYRLACEAAETFVAVAPVAGVMSVDLETCTPSRPVSVIHFHGMSDLNVLYEGRPWLGVPGVPELMTLFAAHDGCDRKPVVTLQIDDVLCETWPGCGDGAQVSVCRVDGGGHCWPGNPECPYGDSTTTISANGRMFDAFDELTR